MKSANPSLVDAKSNDLFEQLADEFTERLRTGERPDIDAIADQHPAIASRIRTLFPMLVVMESGVGAPNLNAEPIFPKDAVEGIQRLGDFRIIREIGRGGMGIVYEAMQESLGRTVALKVLPHAAMDSRSIERFGQEARLAAMLHHTNIVPVHGTGQQQGYSYFVMQYIEGESLDRVLVDLKRLRADASSTPNATDLNKASTGERHSRSSIIAGNLSSSQGKPDESLTTENSLNDTTKMSATMNDTKPNHSADRSFSESGYRFWHNIARVGLQVAEGLTHAHSQGILHRDIKPSNLILDEAGSLWITDFGLAKLNQSVNLTRTGEVVGTLRYMPPEHISGVSDQRSDIYGLGLTLYEMATLEPAFQSSDHRRLMAEVIECKPLAPRKINPKIPRDLETIIVKAISLEPEKRYQTAADLGKDLRRFLEGQPIKARPISAAERFVKWTRRHPAIASLSALVLLSVCAGIAGITWKWREADTNYRESLRQSLAREKYFARALDAVDQMLARVGSDKLAHVPRMNQIRQELLQDALQFYTVFLDESDDDPSLRAEIGKVQRRSGDIHALLGDSQEAITSYNRSKEVLIQLREEFPDETNFVKELAAVRSSLGSVLLVLGEGEQAELECIEAIRLLEFGLAHDSVQAIPLTVQQWTSFLADARYHLGTVQVTIRGNGVAIPELIRSKELFEQLPTEVLNENLRLKYARCLGSISQLYDSEGRIEEALELGKLAVERLDTLAEEFPDVPEYRNAMADSQQYLSGVLARQGNFAQAVKEVASEIEAREALVKEYPDLPDFQSDLSRAYAIYGGMLHQMGQEEIAETEVLKAVELAESLAAQYPDNVAYLIEAGYVTQVMGTNLTLTRRKDKEESAIAYSKRSYELRKQVVEIRPNDRASLIDLATAARNYAAILFSAGAEAQETLVLSQEAIDLCRAADEADPNNADTLYQLAYNQVNLSRMQTELQVGNPMETLQAGIASLKKLIAQQPSEPRHRLQLTRAYDQLANLQFRAEELEDWEDTLRQANETMQGVIEKFGADSRLVQFLTISQNRLGHCLKVRGHAEQALTLFKEAIAYRQQVLARDPTNPRGLRETASAHRNLAWLYAYFLDKPNYDTALEHALKAVELDPENPECSTVLAYVYFRLNDHPNMTKALAASTAEKPTDEMGRWAIQALAAKEAQQTTEAQEYLARAEQLLLSEEVQENFLAQWLKPELFSIVKDARHSIGDQ